MNSADIITLLHVSPTSIVIGISITWVQFYCDVVILDSAVVLTLTVVSGTAIDMGWRLIWG